MYSNVSLNNTCVQLKDTILEILISLYTLPKDVFLYNKNFGSKVAKLEDSKRIRRVIKNRNSTYKSFEYTKNYIYRLLHALKIIRKRKIISQEEYDPIEKL